MKNDWEALDIVKFLLVFGMIFTHSIFWLISSDDTILDTASFLYPLIIKFALIGLLPLAIPITAGCMLRLHLEKYWRKSKVSKYPIGQIFLVGFVLMVLGFLMNLLAFGMDDIFDWDVLQFIGLSFILIVLSLRFFSLNFLGFIGVLLLLLTPYLRTNLLVEGFPLNILLGDSSGAVFWPLLPWICIVIFGVFIADIYSNNKKLEPLILFVGIALVSFSFFANSLVPVINPSDIWGPSMFQPSTSFILGLCGFFLILIFVCELLSKKISLKKYGIVKSFSKGILWIYLLHIIIGYRASNFVSVILSEEVSFIVFPGVMILLSWLVGVVTIKYLYKKQLVINLRRSADK